MNDTQRLLRVAKHEASHAALAAYFGFHIDYVRCYPRGETVLRLPLEPWQFAFNYRRDPRRTLAQVQQVLAVLHAPYIAQNELMKEECGDHDRILEWRQAYEVARCASTPCLPAWTFVHGAARQVAREWLVSRRWQVDTLAQELLQRRRMTGREFLAWVDCLEARQTPTATQVPYHGATVQNLKLENVSLCSQNS